VLRFDPIAEAQRQWEERGLPQPVAMAGTTSIMRAQQLVLSRVDAALRPFGLTFAHYEALRLRLETAHAAAEAALVEAQAPAEDRRGAVVIAGRLC
jgi:hypothetical protein